MSATLEHQSNDVYLLRLSGVVKQSEFAEGQKAIAHAIDSGAKPRILAILENFEGWEKGADWNDLDFLFQHWNEIAKVAIVGEPRWEPEALAFAGAGFRSAPVKFFPSNEMPSAQKWIVE
jgi:hypothetical protein